MSSFLLLLILSVSVPPILSIIDKFSLFFPILTVIGLLIAGLIFTFIRNSKKSKIAGIVLGIISGLFFLNLVVGITGITNQLWGSVDCGGIDPGFNTACNRELYGKKKSCFLFMCKIEESKMESIIPKLHPR